MGVRRRDEPAAAPSPLAGRELASLSFAVVDVETTGTSPNYGDRITEIAVVRVRNGAIVDEESFAALVDPECRISGFITQLTGITNAMVHGQPPFRERCAEVTGLLQAHDVFVAHNVGFDWSFVSSEIVRARAEPVELPRLCTVRLARKLLPHLPRRTLDALAHHYGFGFAARHRALGDAEVTARVLLRLLDDAAQRGCHTWDDLEALLAPGTSRARRRRSALPRSTFGEDGV